MFKRLHGQAVLRVGLTGGAAAAVVCAAAIILFHYGGTYRDWLLNPLVWVVLLALGVAAGFVVGLWLEYESSRALRKDLDEIRYGVRVLTEGNLHYRWKEWGAHNRSAAAISLTDGRPVARSDPPSAEIGLMRKRNW